MKTRRFAAMLFVVISFSAGVQAQAQKDSVFYVDPKGQYNWVIPRQQVKGLDVKVWAFHAYLKNGSQVKPRDNAFVQFFVPDGYSPAVEIRQAQLVYALKPGAKGWSAGLFQCLDLPNVKLREAGLELARLSAVGIAETPNGARLFPVVWNAQTPDEVSHYEFTFMPNQPCELKYAVLRVINPEVRPRTLVDGPKKFYPGNEPFTINWDGRMGNAPAPDGIYKLVLEGTKFLEYSELDFFGAYLFYHKPLFTPCPQQH